MMLFMSSMSSAKPSTPSVDQPEVGSDADRLRQVLRVNSAFSLTSGLVAVLATGSMADWMGVEQVWIMRTIGAGLLAFAVGVFAVAAGGTTFVLRWGRLISFADFGWVAATVGVIELGLLSTNGSILMAALGVVVFALAVSQVRTG